METISTPISPASSGRPETFERCEQCHAAVAHDQRYCVECGAHRRYVPDPAVRYLRSRAGGARPVPGAARAVRRGGPPSLALAALMAVVPVAVALGVLLGRSSASGDAKLVAALRAQRPEMIAAPAGTSSAAGTSQAATSSTPLVSTFPLQNGWAVELQTLPRAGASQASVGAAEAAARTRHANNVGLIVPSGFRVTPKPPAGAYVIYSGAYHSRAAAEQALSRLSHRFSHARVIHVQAVGASAAAGGGKALSSTGFGTAHQITGSKPTSTQLAAGKQVVQHIQQTQGKSYVNAQRGLPDQISIP